MTRIAFVAAALVFAAGSSRADVLPLVGVPSSYTPGQDFSFDVFAPGLVGLTDYSLQFTVTAGLAPNAPDLTVNAAPATAGYPFPDTSNFSSAQTTVSNETYVSIADATSGAGVNTQLGVNDRLATISISPGVNLSGPITISFTLNEFTTARDVSFDLPAPIVIPQSDGPVDPQPVPAPPGAVLLGIGGLCLLGRARFRRSA
jgi:hypothetical protein